MSNQLEIGKEYALESIISSAVQIPGVKVSRNKFLSEVFAEGNYPIQDVLDKGPLEVGVTKEELKLLATKLIFKRTSQSSIASFVTGIPGGFAMAATIPADILQFFGMSLRLAQEISYLYGSEDLWQDEQVDVEKIRNQLILYCGVMFGVSGAVSGVRVISTQLAKTTLKKLPQKALTKTFWYPIIKKIGAALSLKVTKTTVANGASKAIPVIGGVISGSLNFVSMMPMANRLQSTFEKAIFDYSDDEFEKDIEHIASFGEEGTDKEESLKDKLSVGLKNRTADVSKWISKKREEISEKKQAKELISQNEVFETIERLKDLLDAGVITQEEFDSKKADLLDRI